MKIIKIIIAIIIAINFSTKIQAQTTVTTSTISVKGNCGECKDRIENAADIKGVKNAVWNEKSKVLSVTYDSKKVSLEQIEKAIAKAGHTTNTQKADTVAYKGLPDCCKYEKGACEKK